MDDFTIAVPYMYGMESQVKWDPKLIFFDGVNIPGTQGGREPFFVKNVIPTLEETIIRITELGPRYKVLATSTEPEWSEDFRILCYFANKHKSVMVVANMSFGFGIHVQYPDIELHSSSIAGLIYPIQELVTDTDFLTKVGLPNLYHASPESIIANTKPEWRDRLVVIVIKYCPWLPNCIKHYQRISQLYKEGNWEDKVECFNTELRPAGKPVTAGPLYKAGFRNFKLAARIALGIDYANGCKIIEDRIKQCYKEIEEVRHGKENIHTTD